MNLSKLFCTSSIRYKPKCIKDPSIFFGSNYASEFIQSLQAAIPLNSFIKPIETLALKISRICHADYVLITQYTNDNKFKVAACTQFNQVINKKEVTPFTIPFLPKLIENPITFSQNSNELLSLIEITDHHDHMVTGMLIKDTPSTILGAIFILSKKNQSKLLITNTLKYFSFYVTSELRHLISKENLEEKNRELLKTEEELKQKNRLLDNLNKNLSKAKQIVDESSRLKSAFLANLSHEIRTPMNVIMGFTELLNAEDMSANQRRQYIDIIQQNGTRLLQIMDSLIDISRFQAKKIGKELQAFSLNQMMKLLHKSYLSEINISGKPLNLELSLPAPDGEDFVYLDKEATFKILNHLLDNAVKFTASGFVKFGYEIGEKQITFFVEDSGIGIPEGKEKEIFDLFRQGDLRLSRQYGGTGLGLAIAKRYVNAMGGQIWCSNRNDGNQGAVFKFTLPSKSLPTYEFLSNTTSDKNTGDLKQTLISNTWKPKNR
ncbi:sensor histidine kinase [Thermophagus xiamenensis]|uniref:histidine kinase n=1 Tax=Thermophagus xiamenensis TaxID=385682 RepID=A0A1I1Y7K5_9BACT|nr:ATP-binding protein [Thermophagus xiamenensis]SFE15322.1 Signal transduction histidine kinase [Thermophagus xiamenensis]